MKLNELLEQRSAIVTKMTDAHTADNADAFTAAETELRAVDSKIERAKKIDELDRSVAGTPLNNGGGEFDRELRSYSLAAAINGALSGRLTGREAEIDQELKRGREARSGSGIHIAVPSEILLGVAHEERAGQMVGSNPAGGWMVGTQTAAVADRFRPALKVEAMGATVMRGLTGFLDLPNLAKSGTANWIVENQNAQRSEVAFNTVSMEPRTVTAEYRMSRRIMLQTAGAMEGILRRDIGSLLSTALDAAAIYGNGVTAPLGLLQTPGVEKVTNPFAGQNTEFTTLSSDLMAALELDDVTGTAAFLTNPTVMNYVRKRLDGDGHAVSIAEQFHNQRVESTTQVPKNIGAGTDKSALIYGVWSELIIGYWSAVDILINPYHPDVASNGGALLHAFLDADTAIRHPQAFAYAEI